MMLHLFERQKLDNGKCINVHMAIKNYKANMLQALRSNVVVPARDAGFSNVTLPYSALSNEFSTFCHQKYLLMLVKQTKLYSSDFLGLWDKLEGSLYQFSVFSSADKKSTQRAVITSLRISLSVHHTSNSRDVF